MISSVTKLRVDNEDFLVASMIERCPRSMMIRELLQNALEAAATAPEGRRRVEFSALPVEGTRKLAIWNSGTGLSGEELFRMCDIASSIRKETGLDRNFGMGAKVASLPSNQRGLRYRSARQGEVGEVVIGKFNGVYGRLLRPGGDGRPAEVIDAGEAARAEGRRTGEDWTEVVLLGNAAAQDTVSDPYNGRPRVGPRWLVDAIGQRFFRFPEGVEILLQPGIAGLKAPHRLTSLATRLARLARYEAVHTPEGITIHYAYDPAHPTLADANASQGGGPESASSLAALVHQDEMYGVLSGQAWRREAPSFGIPFVARHVTILVELPSDYPVQPEAYREFLRYRTETQAQVKLLDFAGLVTRHQPGWLAKLLADASPAAAYAAEVQEELRQMLEQMGVARRRPRQSPPLPKEPPPPRQGEPRPPAEPKPVPLENAPAIFLLRDPAELADRDLLHRAACYYPETHQLHVNLTYGAVGEMARMLLATAPEGMDAERVAEAAQLQAERGMVLRIARGLAYALAKRGRPQEWKEPHLRAALSPEVLTLIADDIRTGWAEAEAGLARALGDAEVGQPAPELQPA
ncbi:MULTISPECIES: ATP-binding protein [Acetobacterales]|uniref:ATP-binding protein n=1 Tax=Roseomonas sp. WGS1072 TaxID=3366816 RepID=UPI003BF3AAFF